MATWATTFTVVDLNNQVINVTATRTDGQDVRTFSLSGISYMATPGRDLAAIRGELATTMHGMYAKEAAIEASIEASSAAIATHQALMATALNALEA